MKHSKLDKIFQKSSKPPLQQRGEKVEKRQKIKKIRLKLLKCRKTENQNIEFKIVVEGKKALTEKKTSRS